MKKLATWISKVNQQFRSIIALGGRSLSRLPGQISQLPKRLAEINPSTWTWAGVKTNFIKSIQFVRQTFTKRETSTAQDQPANASGLIEKLNQNYLKLPPPYSRFLKPFIITVSLVVAYTLFGFFLLPAVLKAKIPSLIHEETGRKSSIAKVEFNPFKLVANIEGFKILEKNGKPFVEFNSLNADINGFQSIKQMALVIDEVALKKPIVRLAKLKDGKFNYEDMTKSKKKEEPIKEGELFPFNIAKLSIKDGKLLWDDKHFAKSVSEEIAPINLNVSDLSTEANAKAKVDFNLGIKSGGKLELKTNLGINPVFSEGGIKLDKVQLKKVLALALSDTASFDVQGHELFKLDYKVVTEKKALKATIKKARIELQNFQFDDKSTNKTLAKTPSVAIETDGLVTLGENKLDAIIKKAKLDSRNFKFTQALPQPISVEVPVFNHEMDLKLSQTKDGLTIDTNKAKVTLKNLKFVGLTEPMTVVIPDFSHESDIKFSQGKDGIKLAANSSKITIKNVQFAGLKDQKVEAKTADLTLESDFNLGLADKNTDVIVNKGKFALHGLEMSEKGEPKTLVKIPAFGLDGIGFNLKNQEVIVENVTGKDAEFQAWLNKDGTINYQTLFTAPKAVHTEPKAPDVTTDKVVDFNEDTANATAPPDPNNSDEPATPKKDWLIKVNNLALVNFGLTFEDKNVKKPEAMTAKPINLKLSNFASTLDTKLPFQLDIGINKSGSIKLNGDAVISPLAAKIAVAVKNVDLEKLQPYLEQKARVDLLDGKFNLDGQLVLQQPPKKPLDVKFKGHTSIADFLTRDQIVNKDLVKWDNLTLSDVDIDLLANRYSAKTLLIEKPYAKVTIRKDKTINFSDIVIADKGNDAKAKHPKPAKVAQSKTAQASKPTFRLDTVKIVDGSSDFADLSLILPFAAQIKSLDGGANGISSEQKSTIKVDLKGSAYDLAPVDIKGEISPYLGNFDVDLKFDGMPMPLVTPYMVQFAGYKIEKGKLTLGLHYQVENKQLKASNNIMIDQLELGEKVDNPNAVSLPLELAITLLKDSDGKIKLDVPLTGSLEDPKFNVGSLVADALVNVLTKIVTAPFNALASLIGGSGNEDLGNVAFKAGDAKLDDKEKSKLDGVAKALKEKTALSLEIKGAAFEKEDWPALQDDALWDQLKQRKADQLTKEEGKRVRAEYVELRDDDYNDMLAEAFIEKFPNLAGKNLIGRPKLINNDAGDFYKVAYQKMSEIIKPDPERLKHLANDRSQAIAKYLVQKAGIPNERVFILDSALDPKREGKDIVSALSLKTN